MSKLPVQHGEFYEVRLESIGGQGAYSAGQMLATIAVADEAISGMVFADYGSEKKGAPVKTFIRLTEGGKTITNYSPVETPNCVAVFHENLFATQDVTNGLKDGGFLIVNTDLSPDELRAEYSEKLSKVSNIATIDATKIAMQYRTKANTAMLGAIFKFLPFLDKQLAAQQIEDTFGYKYPHLVQPNIQTFEDGFNTVVLGTYEVEEGLVFTPHQTPYGYKTQLMGGLIDGGNSMLKNLSSSREGMLPAYDREKCIDCTACDNVCPDFCFVWEEGQDDKGRTQMFLQGIDYNYCKGCLKCVQVCPTSALTELVEERGYGNAHRVAKPYEYTEKYIGGRK